MQGRIYYLDVLRALAIMLVFTGHTVLSYGAPSHLAPLQFGGSGVDLFFMLSGWLIGSQLLSEQKKFGNIDVKRFWFRRWMRTIPAYFAVLFLTLCQLYLTKDNVANPVPYFFFIQNYFYPMEYFTISWSLSVEEQFYLVIAPLILILAYFKTKYQTLVLLILLLLPSVFRWLGWYSSLYQTYVRWDCCLMGVLLAHIYYNHNNIWLAAKRFMLPLLVTGVLCYLMFFYFRWYKPFPSYSDPSILILSLVFACLVFYAVNNPISYHPKGYAFVMHISTRSYSIYLLHPEALAAVKRFIHDTHFIIYYLSALAISLVIAEVLYRFVELPFIAKRDKYSVSAKRI
jgi:peptidoglycan/LPS O-acetylase OafA/YrhL